MRIRRTFTRNKSMSLEETPKSSRIPKKEYLERILKFLFLFSIFIFFRHVTIYIRLITKQGLY